MIETARIWFHTSTDVDARWFGEVAQWHAGAVEGYFLVMWSGWNMGERGDSGKEERLVQIVRRSWRQLDVSPDAIVLVGFSGGRDSTALLAALQSIVPNLQSVHVDHAVRPESAGDAERVGVAAQRLGVPLTMVRLVGDVASLHPGVGLEEALRRERYRAFAEVAKSVGSDVVALGHHAQDQAETVLMHLLRGSGLSGGVGMREQSAIEIPWWGEAGRLRLQVWRPLLDVQPEELDAFVSDLHLPVIEDPSNEDRQFRRNAVRHDVLPLLERVSPGATRNLARFGSLVADEDAFLESLAISALGDDLSLDRSILLDQPVVVRRRMIRMWLRRHVGDVEVSRERIEAVIDVAAERRGPKTIEIGGGWSVEIGRDQDQLAVVMRLR